MAGQVWSMFAYPWDLADEGIEPALDRIRLLGVNRLLLAVSYHAGKFLLPHNPRKKLYYHDSGRIYFTPNWPLYGKLKPVVGDAFREYGRSSGEPGGADLLEAVARAARARGMEVYAWVVGFHNSRLGQEHPEAAVRNAYGEPYRHALCPSGGEARHYVLQMIADLADRYELDGIVLESIEYMGMLHGDHHEIIGVPDPAKLDKLLGICFCDGCRASAELLGVDVESCARHVRTEVERLLAGSPDLSDTLDAPGSAKSGRTEQLNRYLAMRVRTIEDIYRQIRRAADKSGRPVAVYSTLWLAHDADPVFHGVDPARVNPYVDGWIACYPSAASGVRGFVEHARRIIGEAPIHGGVRMLAPETVAPQDVRRYAEAFASEGIRDLCFYNYGLASEAVLAELPQIRGRS